MIQPQTRLKVADNSGAKEIMCFRVLGGSFRQSGGVGDIIVASVKSGTAARTAATSASTTTPPLLSTLRSSPGAPASLAQSPESCAKRIT